MIRKEVTHNMNEILKEVAVTENKSNTGILGIGSGNNILIIIIAILVLCGSGGIKSSPLCGQTKSCCCNHKRRKVRRRRSSSSGRSIIYILLLALVLLGNNSGRNTNTNIINVNSENRDLTALVE